MLLGDRKGSRRDLKNEENNGGGDVGLCQEGMDGEGGRGMVGGCMGGRWTPSRIGRVEWEKNDGGGVG